MPETVPQMLRADALENRERVLEAARALFAEQGVDVTMRQIARRAQVGPATLYLRFPTKQLLIDEAFADEVRSCTQIVDDGCADPDPWRGFCAVIERITLLNGRNHGFVQAYLAANPGTDSFGVHRATLLRRLGGLTEGAKEAGGLRADFAIEDLVLVLQAGRGLASVPKVAREAAARRFAALATDAFRASAAHGELPAAPRLVPAVLRVVG